MSKIIRLITPFLAICLVYVTTHSMENDPSLMGCIEEIGSLKIAARVDNYLTIESADGQVIIPGHIALLCPTLCEQIEKYGFDQPVSLKPLPRKTSEEISIPIPQKAIEEVIAMLTKAHAAAHGDKHKIEAMLNTPEQLQYNWIQLLNDTEQRRSFFTTLGALGLVSLGRKSLNFLRNTTQRMQYLVPHLKTVLRNVYFNNDWENVQDLVDIPLLKTFEYKTARTGDIIYSTSYHPDGILVAFGTRRGRAIIANTNTTICTPLSDYLNHDIPVYCIEFSPDGRYLALCAGRNVQVRNCETNAYITYFDPNITDHYVKAVAFSPDSKHVAFGLSYGQIGIYDHNKQRESVLFSPPTVTMMAVHALAFSPCGNYLASVLWKRILIWNLNTQDFTALPKHTRAVESVLFSPNGKYLASGSYLTIKIWDISTGQCIHTLNHQHRIIALAFTPCGKYVVSGSYDNTIAIWNIQHGQCVQILHSHNVPVTSLKISADGMTLTSGSNDGVIKTWNIDGLKTPDALLRWIENQKQ